MSYLRLQLNFHRYLITKSEHWLRPNLQKKSLKKKSRNYQFYITKENLINYPKDKPVQKEKHC